MFQFTIEASTIEEFHEKVLKFSQLFTTSRDVSRDGSNIMLQDEGSSGESEYATEEPVTIGNFTEIPVRKKPGRKKKAEVESARNAQDATGSEPVSSEIEATPEPVSQVETKVEAKVETKGETQVCSKQDAIAALQELNIKKGIGVARGVLSQFGCARISEVKEDQYCAFIAACKAKTEA